MQYNHHSFFKGDIVDFIVAPESNDKKTNNLRRSLAQHMPYKLVILKKIDESFFLVAVGKDTNRKTPLELETNYGPLFVKTRTFYRIDADSLLRTSDIYFKINKIDAVQLIYTSHNSLLKEDAERNALKRARIAQAKSAKTQRHKAAKAYQRKLEERYRVPYEIATINNDHKRMQEIIDIVGYAPFQPGLSSGKKEAPSPVATFNPKPYNGGRFSPK